MGFTNVVLVDKSEEETRNFGKRKEFAALENLYEVRTIATVGGSFFFLFKASDIVFNLERHYIEPELWKSEINRIRLRNFMN